MNNFRQYYLFILIICIIGFFAYYIISQNTIQNEYFKHINEISIQKYFKENKETQKSEIDYKIPKETQQKPIKEQENLCTNHKIEKTVQIQNGNILDEISKDPNKIIYKYVPKDLSDPYGSHTIPLALSALVTQGDILELGVGRFSTQMLNTIASEQNKLLVSIEMDSEWLKKFIHLNDSKRHLLFDAESTCAKTLSNEKNWGMVFVDHLKGETRHLDLIRYSNKAQILVAHDSEKSSESYYQYSKVLPFFKYHCKYSLYIPNGVYLSTSLFSNSYEFSKLEPILREVKTDLVHVACNQTYKRR